MAAAAFYLIINFGGNFNAAAVAIPMDTYEACTAQVKSVLRQDGVKYAFCVKRA